MAHNTGFTMEEDLDFEISFYEDVIRDLPNFAGALIALADAYTRKGLYEKSLEADIRLSRLRPDDPVIHYNLACDYSLLKNCDECIKYLEKAISLGYRAFSYMDKDPDLSYVRKDARYPELIAKYNKRRR